jgi:hypothetical protein
MISVQPQWRVNGGHASPRWATDAAVKQGLARLECLDLRNEVPSTGHLLPQAPSFPADPALARPAAFWLVRLHAVLLCSALSAVMFHQAYSGKRKNR